MLRFYTLPPSSVVWPFILINLNNPDRGLVYIKQHRKHIRAVLIDSGIEIFRDKRIKEYPRGSQGQVRYAAYVYERVKALRIPEVWVTVPDYCDDYHPRSLWLSPQKTNIERTVDNILYAVDNYGDINWLIPVQGWNKQPDSIVRCIKILEEHGITKRYSYFAIANLCVEPSDNLIVQTIRIAKKLLKNKKLHAFGLKMTAIAKVYRTLFSTDSTACKLENLDHHWAEYLVPGAISFLFSSDSTAWTRPCGLAYQMYLKLLNRKRASRKSERDGVVYFWAWIYTLSHKYNVQIEGFTREQIEKKFIEALEWALGEKIEFKKQQTLLDFLA